jgi:allantoin racemase
MPHIALINPNTSRTTTDMMLGIARMYLPSDVTIEGMTASHGVSMIVNGDQLQASAAGVVDMGRACAQGCDGIIISAFGDPGIEELRACVDIPVTGLCEAGLLEASAGGRRFGIATVTPDLVDSFKAKAHALGLAQLYTGTRLTQGDPETLAADAPALAKALGHAVQQSFEDDGAQAVIIGGGPLGQAAEELSGRFNAPVVAPIAAAVSLLLERMRLHSDMMVQGAL